MRKIAVAALLLSSVAFPAMAEITDPSMSCAAYVKIETPSEKTGDATMDKMAADLDKKVHDYCVAHPDAKAMEAAMKAMGG